jgi:hypothetical protein
MKTLDPSLTNSPKNTVPVGKGIQLGMLTIELYLRRLLSTTRLKLIEKPGYPEYDEYLIRSAA